MLEEQKTETGGANQPPPAKAPKSMGPAKPPSKPALPPALTVEKLNAFFTAVQKEVLLPVPLNVQENATYVHNQVAMRSLVKLDPEIMKLMTFDPQFTNAKDAPTLVMVDDVRNLPKRFEGPLKMIDGGAAAFSYQKYRGESASVVISVPEINAGQVKVGKSLIFVGKKAALDPAALLIFSVRGLYEAEMDHTPIPPGGRRTVEEAQAKIQARTNTGLTSIANTLQNGNFAVPKDPALADALRSYVRDNAPKPTPKPVQK